MEVSSLPAEAPTTTTAPEGLTTTPSKSQGQAGMDAAAPGLVTPEKAKSDVATANITTTPASAPNSAALEREAGQTLYFAILRAAFTRLGLYVPGSTEFLQPRKQLLAYHHAARLFHFRKEILAVLRGTPMTEVPSGFRPEYGAALEDVKDQVNPLALRERLLFNHPEAVREMAPKTIPAGLRNATVFLRENPSCDTDAIKAVGAPTFRSFFRFKTGGKNPMQQIDECGLGFVQAVNSFTPWAFLVMSPILEDPTLLESRIQDEKVDVPQLQMMLSFMLPKVVKEDPLAWLTYCKNHAQVLGLGSSGAIKKAVAKAHLKAGGDRPAVAAAKKQKSGEEQAGRKVSQQAEGESQSPKKADDDKTKAKAEAHEKAEMDVQEAADEGSEAEGAEGASKAERKKKKNCSRRGPGPKGLRKQQQRRGQAKRRSKKEDEEDSDDGEGAAAAAKVAELAAKLKKVEKKLAASKKQHEKLAESEAAVQASLKESEEEQQSLQRRAAAAEKAVAAFRAICSSKGLDVSASKVIEELEEGLSTAGGKTKSKSKAKRSGASSGSEDQSEDAHGEEEAAGGAKKLKKKLKKARAAKEALAEELKDALEQAAQMESRAKTAEDAVRHQEVVEERLASARRLEDESQGKLDEMNKKMMLALDSNQDMLHEVVVANQARAAAKRRLETREEALKVKEAKLQERAKKLQEKEEEKQERARRQQEREEEKQEKLQEKQAELEQKKAKKLQEEAEAFDAKPPSKQAEHMMRLEAKLGSQSQELRVLQRLADDSKKELGQMKAQLAMKTAELEVSMRSNVALRMKVAMAEDGTGGSTASIPAPAAPAVPAAAASPVEKAETQPPVAEKRAPLPLPTPARAPAPAPAPASTSIYANFYSNTIFGARSRGTRAAAATAAAVAAPTAKKSVVKSFSSSGSESSSPEKKDQAQAQEQPKSSSATAQISEAELQELELTMNAAMESEEEQEEQIELESADTGKAKDAEVSSEAAESGDMQVDEEAPDEQQQQQSAADPLFTPTRPTRVSTPQTPKPTKTMLGVSEELWQEVWATMSETSPSSTPAASPGKEGKTTPSPQQQQQQQQQQLSPEGRKTTTACSSSSSPSPSKSSPSPAKTAQSGPSPKAKRKSLVLNNQIKRRIVAKTKVPVRRSSTI